MEKNRFGIGAPSFQPLTSVKMSVLFQCNYFSNTLFFSSCPSALGEISCWMQFLALCLIQQKRMWRCGWAFQGNCSWLVGGTQGIMVHPGDLSDSKSSVRPSFWILSVQLRIVLGPLYGGPVLRSLSVCRRNSSTALASPLAPEQAELASALGCEQLMVNV